MKRMIGVAFLLAALCGVQTAQAQTACNDGSYSQSHGSGTCSHHGGEKK